MSGADLRTRFQEAIATITPPVYYVVGVKDSADPERLLKSSTYTLVGLSLDESRRIRSLDALIVDGVARFNRESKSLDFAGRIRLYEELVGRHFREKSRILSPDGVARKEYAFTALRNSYKVGDLVDGKKAATEHNILPVGHAGRSLERLGRRQTGDQ